MGPAVSWRLVQQLIVLALAAQVPIRAVGSPSTQPVSLDAGVSADERRGAGPPTDAL